MHTRENVKAANEDNRSKENAVTEREHRQKSLSYSKQTYTLEEEAQETTATERHKCQNRFRIIKKLCTLHFNKYKSSLQILKLEIH